MNGHWTVKMVGQIERSKYSVKWSVKWLVKMISQIARLKWTVDGRSKWSVKVVVQSGQSKWKVIVEINKLAWIESHLKWEDSVL